MRRSQLSRDTSQGQFPDWHSRHVLIKPAYEFSDRSGGLLLKGAIMRSLINALATLMNPFAYVGDDALPTERLSTLDTFGANPGLLRALTYIPQNLPKAAPLVIVLHGCKQTAERYDDGSGWSDLADRYGFALLFPEQRRVNNWLLGFNWFRPRDNTRGSGEPLSIMHMVEQVVRDHGIDRQRIFITGLSAGGAMTSVMLATYPELFAGGAIIAGLPYGCADTTRAAFRSMKGRRGGRTAGQLATSLRRASGHEGPLANNLDLAWRYRWYSPSFECLGNPQAVVKASQAVSCAYPRTYC